MSSSSTEHPHSSSSAIPMEVELVEDVPVDMEDLDEPMFLPTNIALRIFSYLSRDELDICLLVNKQWKWLVEYGENRLPKRQIDCLVLSTYKEFTFTAYSASTVLKFAFKKYYRDLDICGMEVRKRIQLSKDFNRKEYKFPCGIPLHRSVDQPEFADMGDFHNEMCHNNRMLIYKHHRVVYGKKLFTPPLVFYEKLQWLLRHCEVKCVILQNFTLTDFFVEKLAENVHKPLEKVEMVAMHSCKMRYISTAVFHRLLTDVLPSREYLLENLRYTLPNHVNAELLLQLHKAEFVYIGEALSRYGTALSFNIDDDAFMAYAQQLLLAGRPDRPRRFLGIERCRVSAQIVAKYRKLYNHSKKKNALFSQVLFSTGRFIAGEAPPPHPMPNLPQNAIQVQQG